MGILGGAGAAQADETPFGSIYTTEVMPAGASELEQWTTWRTGKPEEHFSALEGRTEVEYGISDRFLLSLYGNYQWNWIRPTGPGAPDARENSARFTGVSAEAIYQVLNPYTDPLGLALYIEPSIGAGERGLEAKLLLQRNFLDDRLIVAGNVNIEYVWAHDVAAGVWEHESALEFYAGASYRFAPGWFGGAEFLNENEYAGHLIFDGAQAQTNAFYLGPAVHYATGKWWATFAVYNQLPWAGNPGGDPAAISGGRVAGAERWRLRLRMGVAL